MENVAGDQSLSKKMQSQDWAKLIRKLRWMGLEDEASRLQMVVDTLPPDQRGTVSAGPFSTD